MKRIFLILCVTAVLLTGCIDPYNLDMHETPAETVEVPPEDKTRYEQLITSTLSKLYWRYDRTSITYGEDDLPNKNASGYDEFLAACQEIELDPTAYQSSKVIIKGQADIMHYNGDEAGTGYFYFTKGTETTDGELIAAYYVPAYDEQGFYSLKSRNLFSRRTEFTQYEDVSAERLFTATEVRGTRKIPDSGFTSWVRTASGAMLLGIDETSVYAYRVSTDVSLSKRLDLKSTGLVPISAVWISTPSEDGTVSRITGLAVLLSEVIASDTTDDREYRSTKIVFYDKSYRRQGKELTLDADDYIFVGYEDGKLLISGGDSINYYDNRNGAWTLSDKIGFTHGVKTVTRTMFESKVHYLISDGMDLYVYVKDAKRFTEVWRTHLSIPNFVESIYAADLNGDGVNEVYICDTSGTMVRYILRGYGFGSYNENVEFGEKIFAADFNGDGMDDYIGITPAINEDGYTQKLYIAE